MQILGEYNSMEFFLISSNSLTKLGSKFENKTRDDIFFLQKKVARDHYHTWVNRWTHQWKKSSEPSQTKPPKLTLRTHPEGRGPWANASEDNCWDRNDTFQAPPLWENNTDYSKNWKQGNLNIHLTSEYCSLYTVIKK